MRVFTALLLSLALFSPALQAGVAFIENFDDGELLNDPTWIPDGSSECQPDPWQYWFVQDGRLRGEGCAMDRPHRGAIQTMDFTCLIENGSWEFTGRIVQNGGLQVFFAWESNIGVSWTIWIANDPNPPSFGWVNHRAICLKKGQNGYTDIICTSFAPELGRDYHVRAVRQQGMWELYVDGVLIGTAYDPYYPVEQRRVIIYQDKTPIEVDDIVFEDFTGACTATAELDATVDLDPDIFDVEVLLKEPEEPAGQYLASTIELPAGYSAAEINPETIRLSDEEGEIAQAISPMVINGRLVVLFPLSLLGASRITGVPVAEVEVDTSSRLVHVNAAQEPASALDLKLLQVSGEFLNGDTFTGWDAVRIERGP